MKKYLIILLVLLVESSSPIQAANVVLESKDKATVFADLADAINTAVDGDVIYLSDNSVFSYSKGLFINKLIQIRGNGTPQINSNITISVDGMPEMTKPILEGVNVSDTIMVLKSITNFVIRHCSFGGIKFAAAQPNGLIDRCYAKGTLYIPPISKDFHVRNSKIYLLDSSSKMYNSTIFVNCNIYQVNCTNVEGLFINTIINSAHENFNNSLSKGYYCLSKWEAIYLNGNNCMNISEDVLDASCDLIYFKNSYTGEDGTPLGIYGGETTYTLTPTVLPKITYLNTKEDQGIVTVEVRATSLDNK